MMAHPVSILAPPLSRVQLRCPGHDRQTQIVWAGVRQSAGKWYNAIIGQENDGGGGWLSGFFGLPVACEILAIQAGMADFNRVKFITIVPDKETF